MREVIIAAGETADVGGPIYGLRVVAGSEGSTWAFDEATVETVIGSLHARRAPKHPGFWVRLRVTAGDDGPVVILLDTEQTNDARDAIGSALAAGGGAAELLTFGTYTDQTGASYASEVLDLAGFNTVILEAGPVAFVGGAGPKLMPKFVAVNFSDTPIYELSYEEAGQGLGVQLLVSPFVTPQAGGNTVGRRASNTGRLVKARVGFNVSGAPASVSAAWWLYGVR